MRTSSIGQLSVAAGALLLAGSLWAGTEGAVVPPGTEHGKTGHAGKDVYGIVNLVSQPSYGADVNARGQVAFQYYRPNNQIGVGFFDGERVRDISPPNNDIALLSALNDRGEVALQARFLRPGNEIPTTFQPFRWSPARGLVPLPTFNPEAESYLVSINNRGDIVGRSAAVPDGDFQAARWTPSNRLLRLANRPGVVSTSVSDINESNVSVGVGSNSANPEGARMMMWDAAGRPVALGPLTNANANAYFINNRGEVGGLIDTTSQDYGAFLWSPGKSVLRAGPLVRPNALNNAGELVGGIYPREGLETHAYVFSRARGLVDLHPRSYFASEAFDINDSGVAVGAASRMTEDNLAFRWSRQSGAVNLNTRLLDPPAGLVLREARAISVNGDIVADSNVGLVLLRAGGGGTDAPVLGPLQYQPFPANEAARFTLSIRDRNLRESHTATIDWGDGAGPQPVALREHKGGGLIDVVHTYPEWGIYRVVVRVTDSGGRSTSLESVVWLLDSHIPLITGEGVLAGGAAGNLDTSAFRLTAPIASTTDAKAAFSFHMLGKTSFKGEQLDTVKVDGNRVLLEGRGRLDGRPGYHFTIDTTAGDGAAQASRMAVRITQSDPQNGGQRLVLQAGDGAQPGRAIQPTQVGQEPQARALRQGSIRILR